MTIFYWDRLLLFVVVAVPCVVFFAHFTSRRATI